MSITINIYYTGKNGDARKFAKEMIETGVVKDIRNEDGNEMYEYFYPADDDESVLLIDRWKNKEALDLHHKSKMMKKIAELRKKYNLHMKVNMYTFLNNDFDEVIKRRTATRKFSNKKVDEEIINKILEAGRICPTAKNMQPQKILVAKSNEALEKIDDVTPCRYNAPTVLIVLSDKNESWQKDGYSTYEMDATICATHMMLEATNQEVDNIWIEMFDKEKLKEVFNLDDNLEPICLIPIGYKTDDYKGNPLHDKRKPLSEMARYI